MIALQERAERSSYRNKQTAYSGVIGAQLPCQVAAWQTGSSGGRLETCVAACPTNHGLARGRRIMNNHSPRGFEYTVSKKSQEDKLALSPSLPFGAHKSEQPVC